VKSLPLNSHVRANLNHDSVDEFTPKSYIATMQKKDKPKSNTKSKHQNDTLISRASNTKLPKLYEIPKEHTVVIVDCDKFFRSSKLMPGGINFYPTFGLFKNGYFIKELTQKDIINQTLD
jgi:hypothetical protein